jgi:mannan endo-1,4-beta-mannosidase
VLVVLLILTVTLPAAARDQVAMGISIPDGTPNTTQIENALNGFVDANGGVKPAVYSVWSQWGSRGGTNNPDGDNNGPCSKGQGSCYFPTETLEMLDSKGIQGMVWWEPIDPSNPLNGRYARHKQTYKLHKNDAYIKKWAQEARQFGQANDTKIILRLAHEANGTWFPWTVGTKDNTATTFKKFWRYVYRKFKGQGALPYVDFLWSVTNKSCKGCNPYTRIFPGNDFIDFAGITAFNWGKQRKWKAMPRILERPMGQLWKVTRKPVIVAELASHFRPTSRSKAAWIRNGYVKTYDRWSRIKAIMYLDSDQPKQQWGHPDWRLRKPGDGSAQAAYTAISEKHKFTGSLLP